MISVVIPLYNKEKYIEKTIQSVLNQTFQDFEIVIVDDGSTDSSVNIVKKFTDNRIRIIQQKNSGVSAARNKGITESKGEWIALLDGDDEWKPQYLSTQFELTKKFKNCQVFATNYELHDENNKVSSTVLNHLPFEGDSGVLSNYFEVASFSSPPICSISIMTSKEIFDSVGGFPLGIKSGEDLLTWARLASRYRIAYCKKPLAIFNVVGYALKEKPKRMPSDKDIVEKELIELKKSFAPIGIDLYISHWHKMRSSIYMRLGMRKKSIREALIGLRFNPQNYKLFAFIVLNLLPKKIQPF